MASQQPPCSWAQRKAKLFLTLDLLNTKGDVTFDAKSITFKGTGQKAGQDGREWNLTLDLIGEIVPAECSFKQSDRCIEIVAAKKDKEAEYWEKLVSLPGKVTKSWLTTNWALYCEEEDEDEAANAKVAGFGYGDKARCLNSGVDSDEEDDGVAARPADISDITQ